MMKRTTIMLFLLQTERVEGEGGNTPCVVNVSGKAPAPLAAELDMHASAYHSD